MKQEKNINPKELIPNEETIETMQEAREGKLIEVDSIDNLFDDLNKCSN